MPITHFSSRDLARTGILLARTVPSGDGGELENAQALGRIGAKNFDFLHPVRTKGRITTVKRSEGKFVAQPGRTLKDERIGFRSRASSSRRSTCRAPAGPAARGGTKLSAGTS